MGKRLDRLGPCPSLLMRLDGATPRPIPMPRRNATTQKIYNHIDFSGDIIVLKFGV